MVEGLQPALAIVDSLAAAGDLDGYRLLHAARADLLRRAEAPTEAAKSYARARALVANNSETPVSRAATARGSAAGCLRCRRLRSYSCSAPYVPTTPASGLLAEA